MEQKFGATSAATWLFGGQTYGCGVAGVYRHLFVCSAVRGQLAVVRWPDFFDRLGWIRNFKGVNYFRRALGVGQYY